MNEWDTFLAKLYEKIENVCTSESKTFKLFISNLDQITKLSFLAGGLELPFDKRELWKQVGGIQQFQCTKILGFVPE